MVSLVLWMHYCPLCVLSWGYWKFWCSTVLAWNWRWEPRDECLDSGPGRPSTDNSRWGKGIFGNWEQTWQFVDVCIKWWEFLPNSVTKSLTRSSVLRFLTFSNFLVQFRQNMYDVCLFSFSLVNGLLMILRISTLALRVDAMCLRWSPEGFFPQ